MSNFYIEYETTAGTQYQEFSTGALLRQFIMDNKTTFINHCKVVAKLPEITSCANLFQNCSATSIDLSEFNTSSVTSMANMFWGSQATTLNLSSFDTSKVTNMGAMFRTAKVISLDLRHFDTSNVTTMNHMFMQTSLTELDVSGWNTIKVTNMQSMFYNSPITALDVSSFDTSKVTNLSFMFNGTQVTELDVSNFDLSSATLSNVMFSNCSKLKTIYCEEDWSSYTGITNSDNMFRGCTSLVGAIPYDSSKVDINYANPNIGYFTIKQEPEPAGVGKILFNTNEFKKIMFEGIEYAKIMYNNEIIWSKVSNTGLRNILVGDDLSGKTLYLDIPDNLNELIIEEELYSYIFFTSNGSCVLQHDSEQTAILASGNNDWFEILYNYIVWYGVYTNLNEIILPNDFGSVTFVDENNPAYQYIKIEG